ncbi:MAG: PQQ-binding-like beta-propeller repeat protein [Planctomycetes bacterium]|nr:PQQ-binding-like beta-propeller repeat protein [Planctomycetota bacterium]
MYKQRFFLLICSVIFPAIMVTTVGAGVGPGERALAHHLISKAGTSRGLCSLVGCEGGTLALELVRGSRFFLYVQDPREATVAAAKKTLDVDGLYGRRVLVERKRLDSLPFAKNTVDVVLVPLGVKSATGGDGASHKLKDLSIKQILRVLRPGGRAIIGSVRGAKKQLTKKRLSQWMVKSGIGKSSFKVVKDNFGTWVEITKPKPKGMDSWSHWEHGPDNNPVSTDTVIKAPYRTQWLSGPLYTSMPAITTAAGGRIFTALGHIAHHRREEQWLNTLLARNGYNGSLLWSRKLPDGYLVHRSAFIATEDCFYMIENDVCLMLDPESGREIGRISIPGIEGEWKYIALQDGVLYVLAGVVKDSSETTIVRSKHSHWSWGELSPGYYQAKVPWGFGKTLAAYDIKQKKVLWRHLEEKEIDSRALVIGGGKIFFYCPGEHTGCIDASSGKVKWRNNDSKVVRLIEEPGRGLRSTPGFKTTCYSLYTPDAIYFQAQTRMNVVAISSSDGKFLWTRKKTTNNPNLLYTDDKLFVGIGPGGSTLELEPLTGKTVKDLGFAKRSCARLTATPDSFFCRGMPEGLTRYDRNAKKIFFNGAMRPACNDGVIAANGLLYIGPWLCDCNLSLMGTLGLCSAGDFRLEEQDPVSQRLEVCEGSKTVAAFPEIIEEDWPTYRGNNNRSACSAASVPADPKSLWRYRASASYRPSAPVSAGGLVLVCGDDGKVRAIDGKTGDSKWSFATAGSVTQPPTLWKGRAYVGSSDGAVYCLEAATGRMLWRFRAAPVERRIMVYDRLCSTWPIASGVLVQDGVAYAAAGIIDYDGTYVYALDAETGKPKWSNMTSGHLDKELRKGVSAQGVLAIAGNQLWMPGGNIISPACYSLKDGTCLSRSVGNGSPRTNRGEEIGVLGEDYLIFGGRLQYSGIRNYVNPAAFTIAKAGNGRIGKALHIGFGKIPSAWSAEKFVMANGPLSVPACVDSEALVEHLEKATQMNLRQQHRYANTLKKNWIAQELKDSDTVAFVIAKNAVLAAIREQRPRALSSNWTLAGLNPETGKVMWRKRLPSAVLPGGLLVDRHGRIIVVHEDGSVSCFG